jgi:Phospholipase_D-nuclease N-terminal
VIEFDFVFGLLLLGFWLWALLDCIVSPRAEVRNLPKLVWLLLIVLLWVFGAAAWAILGRPPRGARGARTSGALGREGARRPVRADDLPPAAPASDFGSMTDARSAELDRRIEEWEAEQARRRDPDA